MSEDESFGSDDDIMSPGSSSSRATFANEDEKRAHHNALERKRRDHIKLSFNSLRDAVPHLDIADSPKVSRAEILKKAAEYIKSMRKKNNSHQNSISELQSQNRLLEMQISDLQSIRENGHGDLGYSEKSLSVGNMNGTTSDDETDSGMSDEEQVRKRVKREEEI